MLKNILVFSVLGVSVFLNGCDAVDLAERVKASEERIQVLEEKVEYLAEYIAELESMEELAKRKAELEETERKAISSMFGRSGDEE